jgi:hypothetical protein
MELTPQGRMKAMNPAGIAPEAPVAAPGEKLLSSPAATHNA